MSKIKTMYEDKNKFFDVTTPHGYGVLALRTANSKLGKAEKIDNFALGLFGEAGELTDIYKKHRYHGHEIDTDKIGKEIGDCLWYCAALSSVAGKGIESVSDFCVQIGVLAGFKSEEETSFNTLQYVLRSDDLETPKLFKLMSTSIGEICRLTTIDTDDLEVLSLLVDKRIAGVVWCLSNIARRFSLSMNDIACKNIKKLDDRYKGEFSKEASIARVDTQAT